MMKITGLSHLFKWENLHNWWLTKYFFAPLYLSVFLLFVDFCGKEGFRETDSSNYSARVVYESFRN